MLRRNLAPLDAYLADSAFLTVDAFLSKHPWPILVIPEPDPEVLHRLDSPVTSIRDALTEVLDPTRAGAAGASLDAICLAVMPKGGGESLHLSIGRSADADVVLIDESVSRFHAQMAWDAMKGRCLLMDLGSRNGTFVDDSRLTPREAVDLVPGSVVTFGGLITRFYSPSTFYAWLATGAPRTGASPAEWPRRL